MLIQVLRKDSDRYFSFKCVLIQAFRESSDRDFIPNVCLQTVTLLPIFTVRTTQLSNLDAIPHPSDCRSHNLNISTQTGEFGDLTKDENDNG